MSICWFCNKNDVSGGSALHLTMHLVVSRGQSITYPVIGIREAQYQKKTITLPRCKNCEKEHNKSSGVFLHFVLGLITVGSGIGIGYGSCEFFKLNNIWPCVISGIVFGFGIGILIGKLLLRWMPSINSSIKRKDEYVNHPNVQSMLNQGWAVGEKPNV